MLNYARILTAALIVAYGCSCAVAGTVTMGSDTTLYNDIGSVSAAGTSYDFDGDDLDMAAFGISGAGKPFSLDNLGDTNGDGSGVSVTYNGSGGVIDTIDPAATTTGGHVTIGASGSVALNAVKTWASGSDNGEKYGGNVNITAGGAVVVADYIKTGEHDAYKSNGGDVTITGSSITINGSYSGVQSIETDCDRGYKGSRNAGDIYLYTSGPVTLAKGISAAGDYNSATNQHSNGGDVTVQQNAGGGDAGAVWIGGDIDVRSLSLETGGPGAGGNVTISSSSQIDIDGSILSSSVYGKTPQVVLHADGYTDVDGYIDIYRQSAKQGSFTGVDVEGTSVDLRGQNANGYSVRTRNPRSGYHAGDVIMDASAGDLELAGGLDLYSPSNPGHATLSATGDITLGSLDLSLVEYVSLESGPTTSYITGDLLGFVEGESKLRSSGVVYYNPNADGSGYLNSDTFPLTNGGTLEPLATTGAIPEPAGLGLLGLALLGLRRRRA
jgi:MYXO-CTERM domain-containing protein